MSGRSGGGRGGMRAATALLTQTLGINRKEIARPRTQFEFTEYPDLLHDAAEPELTHIGGWDATLTIDKRELLEVDEQLREQMRASAFFVVSANAQSTSDDNDGLARYTAEPKPQPPNLNDVIHWSHLPAELRSSTTDATVKAPRVKKRKVVQERSVSTLADDAVKQEVMSEAGSGDEAEDVDVNNERHLAEEEDDEEDDYGEDYFDNGEAYIDETNEGGDNEADF